MNRRALTLLGIFQLGCSTHGGGQLPVGAGAGAAAGAGAGGAHAAGAMAGASGGAESLAGGAQAGSPNQAGMRAQGGAGAVAGDSGAAAGGMPSASDLEAPNGYVPALVGVGYGGIRVVSLDGGSTWGHRASLSDNGGDDENLLRAVVYGKGKWIATGWKLVTSNDGKVWTDHGLIHDEDLLPCNIVEGLAYTQGWFYAACSGSPSRIYRSADGLEWAEFGTIGNTQGHLFLSFRDGKFMAYGDNEVSFESADGSTFNQRSGIQRATYCEDTWKSQQQCFDAAWFDGVYLRADWQGKISRSVTGNEWATVYLDDQQNTLYQARAIAQGFVAP